MPFVQRVYRGARIQTCRICFCTDNDCRQCIRKIGKACSWAEPDLCTACIPEARIAAAKDAVVMLDEWAESLRLGHIQSDGTWAKQDLAMKRKYEAILRAANTLRSIK